MLGKLPFVLGYGVYCQNGGSEKIFFQFLTSCKKCLDAGKIIFAVLETLHSTTVSISQVFFVVIKARNLFGAMPVNKTPRLLALYGLFGSLHNFYFM